MKVCIFGASLDVGNRGVLALGVSVARLLAQSSSEAEIVYHYGNPVGGTRLLGLGSPNRQGTASDVRVTVRNCRLSPRSLPAEHILVILGLALLYRLRLRGPARRNEWLRSLLDADVIGEIRGGDSFSDIYGFRRFLLGSLPLLTVVVLGRPYVMLPQTYGPFRLRSSRLLASLMLRKAQQLFTRDRNCVPLVRELSGRTPAFCPDVAFTLEPLQPQTLDIRPAGFGFERLRPLIGVNVSGLLYMGGYTGRNMFGLQSEYPEFIDSFLESLLQSTDATLLLVPHVFGSEKEEEACAVLSERFGARYPGRIFAVAKPLSERELKWVIGKTDFFVGSRMHACIAGLSQFVPTIGLAYSDKFLGVFESAGVGEATIDLRTTSVAEVVERTLSDFRHRDQRRAELMTQIPIVQAAVRTTFRGFSEERGADTAS
jgi:colanic acid/amylovoran biosynthesis protein